MGQGDRWVWLVGQVGGSSGTRGQVGGSSGTRGQVGGSSGTRGQVGVASGTRGHWEPINHLLCPSIQSLAANVEKTNDQLHTKNHATSQRTHYTKDDTKTSSSSASSESTSTKKTETNKLIDLLQDTLKELKNE